MRALRLVPLSLLAVAACSGQPQTQPEPWRRPDHMPPSATDTSYCRQEGRRQAETIYPDRAPNDAAGQPRTPDQRNFPAEIRFYEQCMTRLGYVRAPVR